MLPPVHPDGLFKLISYFDVVKSVVMCIAHIPLISLQMCIQNLYCGVIEVFLLQFFEDWPCILFCDSHTNFHATVGTFTFLIIASLIGRYEVVSHCSFNSHFPDGEHFFISMLAFCSVLKWFIGFLKLKC